MAQGQLYYSKGETGGIYGKYWTKPRLRSTRANFMWNLMSHVKELKGSLDPSLLPALLTPTSFSHLHMFPHPTCRYSWQKFHSFGICNILGSLKTPDYTFTASQSFLSETLFRFIRTHNIIGINNFIHKTNTEFFTQSITVKQYYYILHTTAMHFS